MEDLTSGLTVSPVELPAIANEQLRANALLRLSGASPGDNNSGLVKNEQLAQIGFGTMSYCLTLAVCKALGTRWNKSESTTIKQQLLDHKFTSRLAVICGLHRKAKLTDGSIEHGTEALGSSFEAYVGALHEDGVPSAVYIWLDELFTPYILPTLQLLHPESLPALTSQTVSIGDAPIAPPPATCFGTPTQSPTTAVTPVAAPEGSLQQLNQALEQAHLSFKLMWDEKNVAQYPPSTPQWQLTAHFQCENGTQVIVGQATDNKKKSAKNAAAHNAYHTLRQMGELSR